MDGYLETAVLEQRKSVAEVTISPSKHEMLGKLKPGNLSGKNRNRSVGCCFKKDAN